MKRIASPFAIGDRVHVKHAGFVIGGRVHVKRAGRGTVIQVGPTYVSTGRLEYQTVTVALDTVLELGGNWRVGTVTEAWIACDSTRF